MGRATGPIPFVVTFRNLSVAGPDEQVCGTISEPFDNEETRAKSQILYADESRGGPILIPQPSGGQYVVITVPESISNGRYKVRVKGFLVDLGCRKTAGRKRSLFPE
jgi:hypothetical protein